VVESGGVVIVTMTILRLDQPGSVGQFVGP
jgi:hypothetical protein